MAIEKVKRTWFLVERDALDAFIQGLAASRTVHVVDLKREPQPANGSADDAPGAVALAPADAGAGAAAAQENAHKLSRVLDILDGFAPPKRAFHENFVNLPAEMRRNEFERAVADTRVDELHDETVKLGREHAAADKRAEELAARIARLEPWAEADVPPAQVTRCGVDLGTVPARGLARLERAAREVEGMAIQPAGTSGAKALVAAVWLTEAQNEAAGVLQDSGFESLALAAGAGKVGGVLEGLRTALSDAESEAARLAAAGCKLAEKRRAVLAARAHWESESEKGAASGKALASKRIVVLSGYVRVREMKKLEALLAKDFPSVGLVARDPEPDEDVPVSLGGWKLFAPAQFLTSMFGLPNYFEFDPSPYIFFTFLIFFGFCFGDVVYGIMLFGAGWWLAHKSREYPSLARFFMLLMWGGLASIVVGALTGSWAADLLDAGPAGDKAKYLGESGAASALVGLRANLMLVDPLKKTVLVLGIALAIGMLNQFYGMALLMHREWRKRNYFAALCDGGLWLVFLPGLLLLLVSAAAGLEPVWRAVALSMAACGAIGLVLTQGRHEKTFLGKAITGVVSLYGILGTYGTTSFIGDTLSYSRLLALGLTTTIVGMAFNIIAVQTPGVLAQLSAILSLVSPSLAEWVARFFRAPVIAILIAVVIIVGGHAFNFLISILGGFVHSARLIFVEFFTKFYGGGGAPFAPLGAPQSVRVIDDAHES